MLQQEKLCFLNCFLVLLNFFLSSPSNITGTLLHSIHMYMYSHPACSREKNLTFPLTVDQKFPQLGSLSTRCQSFNPPSPNRLIRSNKPIEDCAGSIFYVLYHLMRVVVMTNYRAILTTHAYVYTVGNKNVSLRRQLATR